MTMKSVLNQEDHSKRGPKAPKDPVEKRKGFFVMLDTAIEATARKKGKPSQEIYLDGGRLKSQARLIGGIRDEGIIELLGNCSGFHKLVHSIGVTVQADHDNTEMVNFVLNNYSKVKKHETGTLLRIPCPTDGREIVFKLEDYQWSPEDNVLGKFAFEFENAGETAKASVKFYLHDGYEAPKVTTEPPVAFDSVGYQAMIAKSLLSKGNNKRLKDAIEKAERGEHVTIAYIGGSITQGAGAKPLHTNCYAYKSYSKFKEMFGKGQGDNIHFVKAGVGGTPSELGMIRYERDVLKEGTVQPDIVVVEFAVNDEGDETKGVCYESLIMKILSSDNKPAVILLFSVFLNEWNLQDRLSPVGKHYNLPMVSVKDAVVAQFYLAKAEGNIISKRQFFYDMYHPTNDGHRVMADCLSYLLSEIKKDVRDEDDIIIDKAPVIGNYFADVHLLDRRDNRGVAGIAEGGFTETDLDLQMVEMDDNPTSSRQFPYNWMHTASSGKESFRVAIKSRGLILVFKDSESSAFGKADVFVDGQLVKTLDPHEINWTHCNAVILYREEASREHLVEIKMALGDEDKCFTILGFGYIL